MQSSSDPHAMTLDAFYSRVIDRVCSAYRQESNEDVDDAIARLQQKWQEKLRLYTGKLHLPSSTRKNEDLVEMKKSIENDRDSSSEASNLSSSSSSSSSSSTVVTKDVEAVAEQTIGRPSVQLSIAAMATPSSVFAKMLGTKRKLGQLDGSMSDTEDDVDWQDAVDQETQRQITRNNERLVSRTADDWDQDEKNSLSGEREEIEENEVYPPTLEEEEERNERESLEEKAASSSRNDSLTSALVSADDLAPVSGLSGINLPLQIAADYSKFKHYGNRRGYIGRLHAIVMTWPRQLRANEVVYPGELVWYYPDSVNKGELVKVTSVGEHRHELKVKLCNGSQKTVPRERVRRLSEYLIRQGRVWLASAQ